MHKPIGQKSRIPFRIFIVLFLMLPLFASGQEEKTWTLQECIAYAMENNIQIKQQMLTVELTEYNLLESKASMLPSLNANASHGYNWGRTIDRFTNDFATERVQFNNFYLSTSVSVFNGFRMLNTVRKNQLELMAAKYDVDRLRDDVSLSIATAYLSILFSQEQLENIRGQAEVTRQQVERTRQLVEAGTLAKGALLTIEAQYATDQKQVVDAENLLELNYLTLTQMLDLPGTQGFSIAVPQLNMPEQTALLERPGDIFQYALEHQPSIKSAELKLESADKDLSIAKGYHTPSLNIQGSWGTGYSGASRQVESVTQNGIDTLGSVMIENNPIPITVPAFEYAYEKIPFSDQIDQNNNTTLGLYLSIPIFNGFQARTAVNRAKLGILNAEYSLELERNALYKDIQQSYADAVAALKRYSAAQKSFTSLEESFAYTEQRFNVGMVNSVEYNDAKNKLAQSESEVLQAKFEYIFRKTILDYYLGKPISLN